MRRIEDSGVRRQAHEELTQLIFVKTYGPSKIKSTAALFDHNWSHQRCGPVLIGLRCGSFPIALPRNLNLLGWQDGKNFL
jgi:hypothetical protein